MGSTSDAEVKKKGTLRNRPAKPLSPRVKADVARIEARRAARQALDLQSVSLQIDLLAAEGLRFRRDLFEQYNAYPHHQTLIKQLRLGLEVNQRASSYNILQRMYAGICDFIDFLNSDRAVIPGQVFCVADITWHVAKAYSNWLIAFREGEAVPAARYSGLKRVVHALQKKYAEDISVGQPFEWPSGPARNGKPVEPYPDWLYQKIAVAAIRDVKTIMQVMKRYDAMLAESAPVEFDTVSTLENVMATLRFEEANFDKASRPAFRTLSHKRAFELKVRQREFLTEFIEQSGLSTEGLLNLYWERGAELATNGQRIRKIGFDNDTKQFTGMDREQSKKALIATLANAYPDWPFNMEPADAYRTLNKNFLSGPEDVRLYRLLTFAAFGPIDSLIDAGPTGYFAHRMFTPETLFPFIVYVQMTTGWNMSVVASLTEDLDAHIGKRSMNPNLFR